jgi:hypothetical protein
VSVPFPSVRAVEMIVSLAEGFKMTFCNIYSYATNIPVFENPLSVEGIDGPKKSCILI